MIRFALAASLVALLLGAAPSEHAEPLVRALRRVVTAPEATAPVVLERSDPFGGPPERERGRVWYVPGRGLRYRVDGKQGMQLAIDRRAGTMLLYRPSEPTLYEGVWEKAPSKLRRLVAEPERVLDGAARATAERRTIRGRSTSGWRLRSTSLGDSLGRASVWMSLDAKSGLPRFVSAASDVDTLLVEFRNWSLLRRARPADLGIEAPRGTPRAPLDPRELLDRRG
jgi:hypothetical protein